MQLQDVTTYEQFDDFFRSRGIETIQDKITTLRDMLGIYYTTHADEFTPEEQLLTLEQYALEAWDGRGQPPQENAAPFDAGKFLDGATIFCDSWNYKDISA